MKRVFFHLSVFILFIVISAGCGSSDGSNNTTSSTSASYDLTGTWMVSLLYSDGTTELWVLGIEQNSDRISGRSHPDGLPNQKTNISGSVNQDAVSITEDWGGGKVFIYLGTISSANTISGTGKFNDGSLTATWTGHKI